MTDDEIEDLLKQLVTDYRDFHTRAEDRYPDAELPAMEIKARIAWDTLQATFSAHNECTEAFLRDRAIPLDVVQNCVLKWKNGLVWPQAFNNECFMVNGNTGKEWIAQS